MIGFGKLEKLCGATCAALTQNMAFGAPTQEHVDALTSYAGSEWLPLLLIVLASSIALIGLWSAIGNLRRERLIVLPKAKNLFLSVPMSLAPSASAKGGATPLIDAPQSVDFVGHVLALDPRTAVVISPRFLAKGENLTLDLTRLPGFPTGEGGPVRAVVTSNRVMSGQPPTYLVTLRLESLTNQAKLPLIRYIQQLAGKAPGSSWAEVH